MKAALPCLALPGGRRCGEMRACSLVRVRPEEIGRWRKEEEKSCILRFGLSPTLLILSTSLTVMTQQPVSRPKEQSRAESLHDLHDLPALDRSHKLSSNKFLPQPTFYRVLQKTLTYVAAAIAWNKFISTTTPCRSVFTTPWIYHFFFAGNPFKTCAVKKE